MVAFLFFQKEVLSFSFNLNSSRPIMRINIPSGVNRPKKIIPRIIGLTILPSNIPKTIHSLFNGSKRSDLKMVMIRKIHAKLMLMTVSMYELLYIKKPPINKNINVKKIPKLLLLGRFDSKTIFDFVIDQLYLRIKIANRLERFIFL